jgi:hypothetical protein
MGEADTAAGGMVAGAGTKPEPGMVGAAGTVVAAGTKPGAGPAEEAGTTTADTWAGTSMVGRLRVARDLRLRPIRSRLGRAGVCRPSRGLVGLASCLGLE